MESTPPESLPMRHLPALTGLSLCLALIGCQSGSKDSDTRPAFSVQPQNRTVASGNMAVFTVEATGTPQPTFVWKRSQDGGATWTVIPGMTTATCSVRVSRADDGAWFAATATNSKGSATSAHAELHEIATVLLSASSGTGLPGYWRNGAWVALTPAATATTGSVETVAYDGTRVYAAGSCTLASGDTVPGYWRDGTWTALPAASNTFRGAVTSLALGGPVPVFTGYGFGTPTDAPLGRYVPCCWNDQTLQQLTGPSGTLGVGTSSVLNIQGRTLVTGNTVSTGANQTGLWDQGTWTALVPAAGAVGGWGACATVADGHVYVGGASQYTGTGGPDTLDHRAGYWKDGAWTALETTADSQVNALAFQGTTLLAIGWYQESGIARPCLWTGSVRTRLAQPADAGAGYATGIALDGSDIYISGTYRSTIDGLTRSGYWKNGLWTSAIWGTGTSAPSANTVVLIP